MFIPKTFNPTIVNLKKLGSYSIFILFFMSRYYYKHLFNSKYFSKILKKKIEVKQGCIMNQISGLNQGGSNHIIS